MEKTGTGMRGRPKAYDRDDALKSMRDLFWDQGYAATSMDDLSSATAMNRPSLYHAFGDKAGAFKAVLADYIAEVRVQYRAAFGAPGPLRDVLTGVYETALKIYANEKGPDSKNYGRGCFMMGAALTDSLRDPTIAEDILAALHEMDRAFHWRLNKAREAGELPPEADVEALAAIASATQNTIAVRMRAGERPDAVQRMIGQTVGLICGT